MKSRYLLPHAFKKVGWILFFPAVIFGIVVLHLDLQIPALTAILGGQTNDLTNELAAVLVLVSGFFVAFSKERVEDERVSQIRLESLQWSVYLNYALLLIALLVFYDENFLYVMVYNLFTILIFFIVRFHFILYKSECRKPEPV